MSKEKTIREWLTELPEGYRELALRNLDDPDGNDSKDADMIVPNMVKSLLNAFIWHETTEGSGFWCDVRDHYAENRPLPKLPETQEVEV